MTHANGLRESSVQPLGTPTPESIEEQPPIIRRAEIVAFIRQVIRASRELRTRPDRGAEIAARLSGFDPGLVRRCLATLEFVAHVEPDQLDVLVEQERWVAAEQGRPPRTRAELAPLIDTSAYEEALAGL